MGASVTACLLAGCAAKSTAPARPQLEAYRDVLIREHKTDWIGQAESARETRERSQDQEAQQLWRSLDEAFRSATAAFSMDRFTTFSSKEEMLDLKAWLRWAVVSEGADGRYSYAYAALLGTTMPGEEWPIDQFEAAMYVLHGRLAFDIDGARCRDPKNPERVKQVLESLPKVHDATRALTALPWFSKAGMLAFAGSLEETVGERPPSTGICSPGRTQPPAPSKLTHAGPGTDLAVASPSERQRASDRGPAAYAVTNAEVDSSAEFVPDLEWRAKRRRILDAHWDRVMTLIGVKAPESGSRR